MLWYFVQMCRHCFRHNYYPHSLSILHWTEKIRPLISHYPPKRKWTRRRSSTLLSTSFLAGHSRCSYFWYALLDWLLESLRTPVASGLHNCQLQHLCNTRRHINVNEFCLWGHSHHADVCTIIHKKNFNKKLTCDPNERNGSHVESVQNNMQYAYFKGRTFYW